MASATTDTVTRPTTGTDPDAATAPGTDAGADPAAAPFEFRLVRVADLEANPRNVRRDLNLDAEFLASVAANGVRQPLHVRHPADSGGALVVTAGHRRLAAAIAAGLESVPCLVESSAERPAWGDYVDMYTENHHRHDFTRQEEADALFAAYTEGATKKNLGKSTGLQRGALNAALTAGQLTTTTRELTDKLTENTGYTWTLEELAALAEFEDDPDDVARLTAVAGTNRWPYTIERIRNDRAERAEHLRLRTELEEAGYAVTEHLPETATLLDELDHDGEPLTAQGHADCDGRGVFWRSYDPTRFIEYCDDPDRCGHTRRIPTDDGTGDRAKNPDGLDRKIVIEGNKAWNAAAAARHAFLARLLARKTPPSGVARFVAEAIATMPAPLERWLSDAPRSELLATLVGRSGPDDVAAWRNAATDKRLPLVMLASIAAAYEHGLAVAGDHNQVWRTDRYSSCPRADAAVWLRFLAEVGHALTPIEQAVVDGTAYTGDDTPAGAPLTEILAHDATGDMDTGYGCGIGGAGAADDNPSGGDPADSGGDAGPVPGGTADATADREATGADPEKS